MISFIRLRCPGCSARIKAPIQLLGQTRSCPGCGTTVVVQRSVPEDCGPILIGVAGGDGAATAGLARSDGAEGKLILVADDDVALNDGLRVVLEKRGYRVIQAADGIQAKEMAIQERPDLMILDVMMPRMGGYPVLEHFQNEKAAPLVIMITAQEGVRHKTYAEQLGVIDFIRKPFAMGRLVKSVDKGLGMRA